MYNSLYIGVILLMALLNQKCFGQDSLINPVEKRSFFEKGQINGNIAYVFRRIIDYDKNSDGSLDYGKIKYRFNNSVVFNLGLQVYKSVYFRSSWYYYVNKNINVPWIGPDFTYALERVRWDSGTFSYGYTNNGFNKFNDGLSGFVDKFLKGDLYIRYYNRLPSAWIDKIRLDKTTKISYAPFVQYFFKYGDIREDAHGKEKPILGIILNYTVFNDIYLEFSPLYYPVRKSKLNWDPDFTYAFGYNSYSNMTLGFSYGNFLPNRFPWNNNKTQNHSFWNGTCTMMLNFRW
jgi:hypothetical protein